jgi:hypothetical protein
MKQNTIITRFQNLMYTAEVRWVSGEVIVPRMDPCWGTDKLGPNLSPPVSLFKVITVDIEIN